MPLPLKPSDVASRLREYSLDTYLGIGSITKGVALAAATYAGFAIFGSGNIWPRLAFWLASLVAITISYMTWGRGVLLTTARSNLLDSVFPLLMGLAEFSLFAILSPDKVPPNLDQYWFLVFSAHAVLAVALVSNRIFNTLTNEDFEKPLQPLAEKYLQWLQSDRLAAGVIALLSLAMWVSITLILPIWPDRTDLIQTVMALVLAIGGIVPMVGADAQRREMDEFVSHILSEH